MPRTRSIDPIIAQAEHVLQEVYLPRIISCLERLSPEQIWWRPNEASNSVGNLVLHLTGNVRQWIISGLGGAADIRQRDLEFSERGPLPRRVLVSRLRQDRGGSVPRAGQAFSRRFGARSHHPEVSGDGDGGRLPRRRTLLPPRGANHPADQDADGKRLEVYPASGREKEESRETAGAGNGAEGATGARAPVWLERPACRRGW